MDFIDLLESFEEWIFYIFDYIQSNKILMIMFILSLLIPTADVIIWLKER